MFFPKNARKKITVKLLLSVLAFSTFITVITTAINLYVDYSVDMGLIEKRIQNIRKSTLQSLSQSLWYMDRPYAETQLNGLLQLPDIQYLKITSDIKQNNISAGTPQDQNTLSYDFPLIHSPNNKNYHVGDIRIVVNLNNVYQRLFNRVMVILGTQAFKTFLVSGFIFVIVQWLITRHLVRISNFVNQLDSDHLDDVLQLPESVEKENELSQVVDAINGMRIALHQKIQSLRESEARYLDLYDDAPDMYVSVDVKTGEITKCNQTLCRMTGYAREEMVGRSVFFLYHQDCLDDARETFQEFVATGAVHNAELQLKRKDGAKIDVMLNVSAIRDPQGRISHSRSSWRDITELKKARAEKKSLEKKLQQAQRMESVGKLAGGIAHDFNNILYPIIGFTQLSQKELPKDHPVQENLRDVLDGAKRARDLVRRILLFSRQQDQTLKPTVLQPVINESYRLLRATIPANINLERTLYDGRDLVLCNASEIHEMILNLCMNSYHAIIDNRGTITIGLEKTAPPAETGPPGSEYVCLSVRDDGAGIPENIKEKIFEPYVTTKEIGKGSGLGLSIVYGIVKNCRGSIRVDSTPQHGTVFKIFLPVTTRSADTDKKTENKGVHGSGNERILFVDDEKPIVKLGVKALEKKGYRVTGVSDSSEAFRIFQSHPNDFDLVVTDMAMPGMIGSELAKRIIDIRPDIAIIICSGYSERLDRIKAEELNVKQFIDKPLLLEDLIAKVRDVLDTGPALYPPGDLT